jgi:hypothetical protein
MQTTSTKQDHAQESSFPQTQTEIYPVTEGNQSSHTKVAYKNSFNRFLRNIPIKDLQVLLDQGPDVLNPMIIKYVIQKIIDINDNDLFIFLKEAAASLLKIDKIENYLRAVDNTKIDAQQSYLEIKGHEVLNKLRFGIDEFNRSTEKFVIHLPLVDLSENNLQGYSLKTG